MGGFVSAMLEEIGARRRRMRQFFGDRANAFVEYLLMAGIVLGSLGLFIRPWMAPAAPWGFAIPVVFLAGYVLIEARRQQQVKADPELNSDWMALWWTLACALAGAIAFAIAWAAAPAPPTEEDPGWQPPAGSVNSTIVPED
jgi:hypothetical protein